MLFAVSVSKIGQHIVGIRWHMFEVIVCHFKRASLFSRVVKQLYIYMCIYIYIGDVNTYIHTYI